MATGNQNEVEVSKDVRKQLALAVRSIQWSYAIFWSISSRQPGVLEWGEGCYNGDIKTRKTVEAAEVNADELGLQRSGELRELYESLSLGQTNPQARRPTASLSPEDLTDAEWYFLICMSFVFNFDQGLPGRTLAKKRTIWLGNPHLADAKLFSLSLLAKSAFIQTIVCFPHLGGVVEVGSTELVPEDPDLIQHVITSFLDCPFTAVPHNPVYLPNIIDNYKNDLDNMPEGSLDQLLDCPDIDISSPNSANDFADNLLRDESNEVQGEASQIQSWPFLDDNISNCLNNSANSSNCMSQTYDGLIKDAPLERYQVHGNNDRHYHKVLLNVLKSSHPLILGPYFRKGGCQSSFVGWKKDGLAMAGPAQSGKSQKLLKKILLEVAKMHEKYPVESVQKRNDDSQPVVEENGRNHVMSKRNHREKINERFSILGSLVSSDDKVDKLSILDNTIQYMGELKRKVEELESYKQSMLLNSTTQTKRHGVVERISDNYGRNKISNSKRASTIKQKASVIKITGAHEKKGTRLKDSLADDITINIIDEYVLIEIRYPWKDCVLVEIMEAVSRLGMDTQNVQSSNTDGIPSLTIKAKVRYPPHQE